MVLRLPLDIWEGVAMFKVLFQQMSYYLTVLWLVL